MSSTVDRSVEVLVFLPVRVGISMQSSEAADLLHKLRKIDIGKEEVAVITVTVNRPAELVVNSSTIDQLIGGLERGLGADTEISDADKKVRLFSV